MYPVDEQVFYSFIIFIPSCIPAISMMLFLCTLFVEPFLFCLSAFFSNFLYSVPFIGIVCCLFFFYLGNFSWHLLLFFSLFHGDLGLISFANISRASLHGLHLKYLASGICLVFFLCVYHICLKNIQKQVRNMLSTSVHPRATNSVQLRTSLECTWIDMHHYPHHHLHYRGWAQGPRADEHLASPPPYMLVES